MSEANLSESVGAPRYEFKCPVCNFDHKELGRLLYEHEIYCGICAEDNGRDVTVSRKLVAENGRGQRSVTKGEHE